MHHFRKLFRNYSIIFENNNKFESKQKESMMNKLKNGWGTKKRFEIFEILKKEKNEFHWQYKIFRELLFFLSIFRRLQKSFF